MRIGIMGGTFDPIHNAHLHIANAARQALRLDPVLFIPVGDPPHKAMDASAQDRLEMVRLAVADLPWAKACDMEVYRKGRTYSVDTLTLLHEQYSGAKLFYIVGTDALRDMTLWKDAKRAMTLCEVVAVERGGLIGEDIHAYAENAREQIGAVVHLVAAKPMEASSTDVRIRFADGKPIEDLLPETVAAYIAERGLYR